MMLIVNMHLTESNKQDVRLYIDLWKSRQSGISLCSMLLCKQAEAFAWVDGQKKEPEECEGVMKLYIHEYLG